MGDQEFFETAPFVSNFLFSRPFFLTRSLVFFFLMRPTSGLGEQDVFPQPLFFPLPRNRARCTHEHFFFGHRSLSPLNRDHHQPSFISGLFSVPVSSLFFSYPSFFVWPQVSLSTLAFSEPPPPSRLSVFWPWHQFPIFFFSGNSGPFGGLFGPSRFLSFFTQCFDFKFVLYFSFPPPPPFVYVAQRALDTLFSPFFSFGAGFFS